MYAAGREPRCAGSAVAEPEAAGGVGEREDGAADDYLFHEGRGGLLLAVVRVLLVELFEPVPAVDAHAVADAAEFPCAAYYAVHDDYEGTPPEPVGLYPGDVPVVAGLVGVGGYSGGLDGQHLERQLQVLVGHVVLETPDAPLVDPYLLDEPVHGVLAGLVPVEAQRLSDHGCDDEGQRLGCAAGRPYGSGEVEAQILGAVGVLLYLDLRDSLDRGDGDALRHDGEPGPDGLIGGSLLLHGPVAAEGYLLGYLEAHLAAVHVLQLPHPLRDALGADELLYAFSDIGGDLGLGLQGGVQAFGPRLLGNLVQLVQFVL